MFYSIIQIIISIFLAVAVVLFYYYNAIAMANAWIIILLSGLFFSFLIGYNIFNGFLILVKIFKTKEYPSPLYKKKLLNRLNKSPVMAFYHIILSGVILWVFFNTAVVDYYQPFSLYDIVIIFVAVSWGIYSILLLISSFRLLIPWIRKKKNSQIHNPEILSGITVTSLLLILVIPVFLINSAINQPQFTPGLSQNIDLFVGGEGNYQTFRIPALITIPEGSILNNSQALDEDIIFAFAEARKYSDADTGVIDLVMKRSNDAGQSWSELVTILTWEDEGDKMKFGNPTPIFDNITGILFLPYIRGSVPSLPYSTYLIQSQDGGDTWSTTPQELASGVIGPGHGIQLQYGVHAGRLIIPAHGSDGAYSLYSDDHGFSWFSGEPVPEKQGNECEVVELIDGSVYMSLRRRVGVATLHPAFNRLYSISTDGGETWSSVQEHGNIPDPICMASINRWTINDSTLGNRIVFSNPATSFNRGRLTLRFSEDEGKSWNDGRLIYEGPTGYSELTVLSDSTICCLFERGRVEYSEVITFIQCSAAWMEV
ncbi:hypothetical protein WKT22_03404 [Candidatus Lokiarchaeum ossiferum]